MGTSKIYGLFLVLLFVRLGAQTVSIPDVTFRTYLWNSHRSVMNDQQELIIAEAEKYTGEFYCGEQQIGSLEGIQYFKNITKLNCFKNKLTTLPDMSAMVNLVDIQCFENQITHLPSFNKLAKLEIINFGENQLSEFLKIDSLKNLREIYVYRNSITSIPDLSQHARLEKLDCYENLLTSIGKMPASLKELAFGNNLMINVPDISMARGLIALGGWTNRLTAIPDLSGYTSLTRLNLGTNKIKKLPHSLSTMTWLNLLTLDNNLLDSLPDLSQLTQLQTCKLERNHLSFEDLTPSSANPHFGTWVIGPQYPTMVKSHYEGSIGASMVLSPNIDTQIQGLTYSWYHNGNFREQTTTPYLEIASLQKSDAGSYQVHITSAKPGLDTLTITSTPFTLTVLPDFQYEKDLSLTPNGDGKNDEIFFGEDGQLHVYDSRGKLLDQRMAPCYWDGSTTSGKELSSGVYIIQIEDKKKYEITLLR